MFEIIPVIHVYSRYAIAELFVKLYYRIEEINYRLIVSRL